MADGRNTCRPTLRSDRTTRLSAAVIPTSRIPFMSSPPNRSSMLLNPPVMNDRSAGPMTSINPISASGWVSAKKLSSAPTRLNSKTAAMVSPT